MPIAGLPEYVPQKLLADASPGLRFGMYLQLWDINRRNEWEIRDASKRSAIKQACALTKTDREIMGALARRQRAASDPLIAWGAMMRVEALAVAPFTTGLGNEHPLENGFAFLNPYGLPYLPGSGVKGVVRQAARELADGDWGDTGGWSREAIYRLKIGKEDIGLSALDVLFGRETESGDANHVRGALSFWDVVPLIEGDRLAVEVMTPHQADYYQAVMTPQGVTTPHESGSPNPINYLIVPPKSKFTFHVLCDRSHLHRLAPSLVADERWTEKIHAAFAHAFQWLGFGAKTSVGYGAFEPVKVAAPTPTGAEVSTAKRVPSTVSETLWRNASLSWNAGGGGRLIIRLESRKAEISGAEAHRLLQPLPPEMTQQIKRRGLKADVRVEIEGNMVRVIEIVAPSAKEG